MSTEKLEAMVAATAGIQRGLPRVEIQEMTENEKAATFIGWREGQLDGLCRFDDSDRVCQLGTKHCYFDHSKYPLPAPDMTDPRNYMKALEGCVCWWKNQDGWYVIGHSIGSEGHGASPLEALATLYDAEHADNARMKG